MPLPDYHGGSIANLMTSLIAALGGEPSRYPELRELEPSKLQSRNIVLLIIDGLGHDCLMRYGNGEALRRHLKARITSVFPASTATAITTFLTGTAVQQHALTGWHMYFREVGSIIDVLPFRPRYGGPALSESGITAAALFDHAPVFTRIRARSYVVAPERIIHSDFNVAHGGGAERRSYTTLGQMFHVTAGILRENPERKYIHVYWPGLDRLAHEFGIGSREAVAHVSEIDAAFGEFLRRIQGSDTTVVATADHGFIDTQPDQTVELEAHPELARMLILPLCGERRAAYCYVEPDQRTRFEDYVATHLAAYADLFESEWLIESGYFGLGPAHPRLHERVGHYALVMKHNAVIKDWLLGERRHVQIGVHGGISEQEMYVPLIVAAV